jgi:hypothetical protein
MKPATTVSELWNSLNSRERCITFHLGNFPWVSESWENVEPVLQDNLIAIADRCLFFSTSEQTSMFSKNK